MIDLSYIICIYNDFLNQKIFMDWNILLPIVEVNTGFLLSTFDLDSFQKGFLKNWIFQSQNCWHLGPDNSSFFFFNIFIGV